MRYPLVTGVQTCALPILTLLMIFRQSPELEMRGRGLWKRDPGDTRKRERSEERRVGRECRSRWAPYEVSSRDWSSDVCSSDLNTLNDIQAIARARDAGEGSLEGGPG